MFVGDSITDVDRLRRGYMALPSALFLWDADGYRTILARQIPLIRSAGALDHLPIYQESAALIAAWSGDFGAAAALIAEAEAVCEMSGSRIPPFTALLLAGLRGSQAEAVALIDATINAAEAECQGIMVTWPRWVTAVLYNGLGRYDQARHAPQRRAYSQAGRP
jgi:hypothetical protein